MKSIRWGLVTFTLGISAGIIGHYFDGESAFMAVLFLSVIFSLIGTAAIHWEDIK